MIVINLNSLKKILICGVNDMNSFILNYEIFINLFNKFYYIIYS